MVAVDENRLHVRAVGEGVAGEDIAPRGGDHLQLLVLAVVREVAGDHDRIDALVAKRLKRLAEELEIAVLVAFDVNVGDDPGAEEGSTMGFFPARDRGDTQHGHDGGDRRALRQNCLHCFSPTA